MSRYNDERMKRLVVYVTDEDFKSLKTQARSRGLTVPKTGAASISAYVRLIARRYYRVVKCRRTRNFPGLSAWEVSLLDNCSATTLE